VKALDTPVLLALLRGDPAVKDLLRRLRGHEIATTEGNLLELAILAGRSGGHRREALGRLRRKITVLPLDARAVEEVGRRAARGELSGTSPLVAGVLAALESAGCEELFTVGPSLPGKWRFRITRMGQTHAK
jgi:predicted nucleic acid-binding protein